MLRRLPFFLFVALGLWLWRGSFFPQERELVWRLGAEQGSLSGLEIQLYDEGGNLLKREQFFFQAAPAQVVQKIPLKQGHYTARLFLQRPGRQEAEPRARSVEITASEAYGLSVSDAK